MISNPAVAVTVSVSKQCFLSQLKLSTQNICTVNLLSDRPFQFRGNVKNTDYIPSNGRMVVNNELGWKWKEVIIANFSILFGIRLQILNKYLMKLRIALFQIKTDDT